MAGIETASSADDNMDPSSHPTELCPEIVEIMARYGQAPADLTVSDDEDIEEENGIQYSDGEQFPTNNTANTHYESMPQKQQKCNYFRSKSRSEVQALELAAQLGRNPSPTSPMAVKPGQA